MRDSVPMHLAPHFGGTQKLTVTQAVDLAKGLRIWTLDEPL